MIHQYSKEKTCVIRTFFPDISYMERMLDGDNSAFLFKYVAARYYFEVAISYY